MSALNLPRKLRRNVDKTKRFAFDLECDAITGKSSDAKKALLATPTIVAITSGTYSHAFPWNEYSKGILIGLLLDETLEVIAHNILYDFLVLHHRGIISVFDVKAKILDAMVLQFMIDENRPKDLKGLVKHYFRYQMKTYKETVLDNPKVDRIRAIDKEIAALRKTVNNFSRERPYPGFDGKIRKKGELKRKYQAKAEEKWPPTLTQKPDGTVVKRWYGDDKKAKEAWCRAQQEKLEELFSFGESLSYMSWLEEVKVQPLENEKEELQLQLQSDELVYAEDDGRQTWRLYHTLERQLRKRSQQEWTWYEIECYVRAATLRMSANGIFIDKAEAQRQLEAIDPVIEELFAEVQSLCNNWMTEDGESFNPNSEKQVRHVLFTCLEAPIPVFKYVHGIPTPKLTPKGEAWCKARGTVFNLNETRAWPLEVWEKFLSVDSEVLERVKHPLGMAILNYRTAVKLKTTYLMKLVENEGDRIYGTFNSIGTKTGRLSSADPNLQNIPSRKKGNNYDPRVQKIGPILRRCYVAAPGTKMIVADQSQIELRIIAHFTQDRRLLRVYREAIEIECQKHYIGDIHAETSKDLNLQRKDAKGVNFGLSYEMSPARFARMNRMFTDTGDYDTSTASQWRAAFFEVNSGLSDYLRMLKNCWVAGKTNYKMLSGRHRNFPEDMNPSGGKILNSKVQGSSADLLKLAMYVIDKYVLPRYPGMKMIFQVHDELGFEVPEEYADEAAVLVKYAMEYDWFGNISVPVLASAKVCDSWEAKDDDELPEVGTYYARVSGEDQLFDRENWSRMVEADAAKTIDQKGATAMLTTEQVAFCRTIIPAEIEGVTVSTK